MPKPPAVRTPAPAAPPAFWYRFEGGVEQPFLIAPAELAVAWPGSTPTGRITLYFQYWQDLLAKLPPELRPTGAKTPVLVAASAAEAKAITDKLAAFVKERFPKMKAKRQANLNLVRFIVDDKRSYWITSAPESACDAPLDAPGAPNARTWPLEPSAEAVVLWNTTLAWEGPRVRVTDHDFTVVDSELDDDKLDKLVGRATAKVLGTWSFPSGIAVVMWAPSSITELKGVAKPEVAALAALVAVKKPVVAVRSTNREADGAGAILRVTPGSYRGECGGDKKARWVRFVRS